VAGWVVDAAEIVVNRYGGDAAEIWARSPTAADLRARFDAFPGIAQKKAAMAVEILERSLGVAVAELSGSHVAYDVHLRRVFMRTGLAERDDIGHMVALARSSSPRPSRGAGQPSLGYRPRLVPPAQPGLPYVPACRCVPAVH